MKKFLLFFCLFSGFLGCCENETPHWNATSLKVSIENLQTRTQAIDGKYFGDSLLVSLRFEAEFVNNSSILRNPFITSAYALSCPHPGDEGMADPLKEITITSDNDYNEIKAGESLNALFSVYKGDTKTLEEWISTSAQWIYMQQYFGEFIIKEKPAANTWHIFTAKIVTESGEILESISNSISWE